MTSFVQLHGSCQSGRPTSYYGYGLAGTYLWRVCLYKPCCKSIFDNGSFIFLGGDRVSVQITGACLFTQCRADSGGKLWKTMCLHQSGVSLFVTSVVQQIVPLRHQVVQRTAAGHSSDHHTCLTEWDSTCHTSCCLLALFFFGKRSVEFIKMMNSFQRGLCFRRFSFIFHESGWFSHLIFLLS